MEKILDLSVAGPATKDLIEIHMDHKREYVDVRGVYPVYTHGVVAVELVGMRRDVSLSDARARAHVELASRVTAH